MPKHQHCEPTPLAAIIGDLVARGERGPRPAWKPDATAPVSRYRPPPFWLVMLATMSRRHADFVSALRNAKRKGRRIPPRHQIMRAWAVRRR